MQQSAKQGARDWPRAEHAAQLWACFGSVRDSASRDTLALSYQGYVRMIAARHYARRGDDSIGFDEYLQLGQVGLLEAIDRFQPELGLAFETFASKRVAGAILNGIAHMTEVQQQLAERRRSRAERIDSLQPEVIDTPEDQATALFEQLAQLAVGLAIGFTLDDSALEDDEPAYADNGYRSVELRQLREQVMLAVRALPERVRQVISLHYLQQHSFAEVAEQLGLSPGRISQLHREGIDRLRRGLQRHGSFDLRC